MKRAPLQEVKERFQGRKNLIGKVADMVKPREGTTKEQMKRALGSMSNKKLLRIHRKETENAAATR